MFQSGGISDEDNVRMPMAVKNEPVCAKLQVSLHSPYELSTDHIRDPAHRNGEGNQCLSRVHPKEE